MVIENSISDYTLRTSFKFNKDGLLIVNSSKITNVTMSNYSEGNKLGAEIESSANNLTHDQAKQLANFIVKHYKG